MGGSISIMKREQMNIEEELEILIKFIERTKLDAMRFDKGNVAAGVRIRKRLQVCRLYCFNIRNTIQKRRVKIKAGRRRAKN